MQIKMKVSRKGIRPIAVATVAFMVVAVQMQSNNPTIATIALIPFSKMLYSLTIIFVILHSGQAQLEESVFYILKPRIWRKLSGEFFNRVSSGLRQVEEQGHLLVLSLQ